MASRKKSRNKIGLTLVELLVATTIGAFLILLLAAIYFGQFRFFSDQNTAIDVATQNKLALDEMMIVIRESQTIVTSCCSPTETTGTEVLVLQTWPTDTQGQPIDPNGQFDYIIYRRDTSDNTKLVKRIVPSPSSARRADTDVIATHLGTGSGDLSFTYNNADVTQATQVDVSITTKRENITKTLKTTHTATGVLRNK